MKPNFLLALPLLFPLLHPGTVEGTSSLASPPPTTTSALPLSSFERDQLAMAEQTSMHELLDVRGGDLTNDNLVTILLVLGIVVLILILL